MPDTSLDAAIREAYSLSTSREIVLLTVEATHSLMDSPIRLVNNNEAISAKLENTALYNAGQYVDFLNYNFDVIKPAITPNGNITSTLTFDNVTREFTAFLELVVTVTEPIKVTFREYLFSDLSKPRNNPVLTMDVLSANASLDKITCKIGFRNMNNKKFPTDRYTHVRFPALSR